MSEIAEVLGITTQKLAKALTAADAPGGITAKELGHTVAGKNRVWYEPRSVINWWKTIEQFRSNQQCH